MVQTKLLSWGSRVKVHAHSSSAARFCFNCCSTKARSRWKWIETHYFFPLFKISRMLFWRGKLDRTIFAKSGFRWVTDGVASASSPFFSCDAFFVQARPRSRSRGCRCCCRCNDLKLLRGRVRFPLLPLSLSPSSVWWRTSADASESQVEGVERVLLYDREQFVKINRLNFGFRVFYRWKACLS